MAESFSGERRGADDQGPTTGGAVRAGDPDQRRALAGPGLAFDEHEGSVSAAEPDRRALLIRQSPAGPGQLGVEPVDLCVSEAVREWGDSLLDVYPYLEPDDIKACLEYAVAQAGHAVLSSR